RVNGIAHAIREETHPGVDCVAYLLDHSPEMVMTTLAILKAGKTYLAIHPGTPAAAQEEVVREVNPELIVTTAKHESRARALSSRVLLLEEIGERQLQENLPITLRPSDASTIFFTS